MAQKSFFREQIASGWRSFHITQQLNRRYWRVYILDAFATPQTAIGKLSGARDNFSIDQSWASRGNRCNQASSFLGILQLLDHGPMDAR